MSPDHTIAATERGQVQYISFLEAFDFDNGFRLAFRSRSVAPGSVVYKEDNWSRVFSDCGPTYIIPMEVKSQPLILTGTSQRHRFMIERKDGFLSMNWQPQIKPSPRVDNVTSCLQSLSQFGVFLDKHQNDCSCGEIVTVDELPEINFCSTLAGIKPNIEVRDGTLESMMINVVPGVGTRGSDIYFSAGMLCNVTVGGSLAYHSAYLSKGCIYCAHLNAEDQLTRSMDSSLLRIPRLKHALIITTSQTREEVERTVLKVKKEIAERVAADAMEPDDEHAEPALEQIDDLVDRLEEQDEAEVVELEP